mgnify:CR=1 FL=1
MKINTKFDIGDTVFFMENNIIKSSQIQKILVEVIKDKRDYFRYKTESNIYLDERKVFKTKNALIKSL